MEFEYDGGYVSESKFDEAIDLIINKVVNPEDFDTPELYENNIEDWKVELALVKSAIKSYAKQITPELLRKKFHSTKKDKSYSSQAIIHSILRPLWFDTEDYKKNDVDLHITFFENTWQINNIATEYIYWSEFINECKNGPKERGDVTIDEYLKLETYEKSKKKNGRMFSFAKFGEIANEKGGYKHEKNIISFSGLTLDLDDNTKLSWNSYIKTLSSEKVNFIIMTTYSHTAKVPKFRIIIPYDKPVTPEKHLDALYYFNQLLSCKVDPACSNLSLAYHLPSCPHGSINNFKYHIGEGHFFNANTVDASKITKIVSGSAKDGRKINKYLNKMYPGGPAVISGELKQTDISKLPISETCKQIIKFGPGNNDDDTQPDRSTAVFHVVKEMYEHKVPDNDIVSILLDPRYKISERNIERGEIWTRIEVARIIVYSRRKGPTITFGLKPHYHPQDEFDNAEDASDELNDQINNFFNISKPGDVWAVKAGCGIGKTSAVISCATKGTLIDHYVPNYKLAEELKLNYEESNSKILVNIVRGRQQTYLDEDDKLVVICEKKEQVKILEEAGIPVPKNLCLRVKKNGDTQECTHYHTCNYQQQLSKNEDVRIMVHDYLATTINSDDTRIPDYIVIDESFYNKLIIKSEFRFSEFNKSGLPNKFRRLIIEAIEDNQPLLKHLRDNIDNIEDYLTKELKNLVPRDAGINPQMTNEQIESKLTNEVMDGNVRYHRYRKLLTALLKELKISRDESYVLRKSYKSDISIRWRDNIKRLTHTFDEDTYSPPVLLIDADLHQSITNIFFDKVNYQEEIIVKRNAFITQMYSGRNATRTIVPEDTDNSDYKKDKAKKIAEIQSIINRIDKDKKLLVIAPKRFIPHLKLPDNCESLHFGNLRGVDKFKHFDGCLVIGRSQPSTTDIENSAAALLYDKNVSLNLTGDFIEKKRGYNLQQNGYAGPQVQIHPDNFVQTLLEDIRENEILQAIDRLRLIYGERKSVLILTNIPLNIEVNRILDWYTILNGNKLERLLGKTDDGILLLSEAYLHKTYPDIYTENSAKQAIAKIKENLLNPHVLYFNTQLPCRLIKYKAKGKGGTGTMRVCLIRAGMSLKTAKIRLKELLAVEDLYVEDYPPTFD